MFFRAFVCKACLALAFGVLSGWVAPASSAILSVSPTRIQLPGGNETGTLVLTNRGDTEAIIQVETFLWSDTPSIEALEPTKGIIAVPAVFRIGANQEQLIRVRERPVESDSERTYRLVISEVPKTADDPNIGIQFALRINLPVFITPGSASALPSWDLNSTDESNYSVGLNNTGNAHLHVQELTIEDARGQELQFEQAAPFYVLAGQGRSLPLNHEDIDLPIKIQATTNLGPILLDLDD